MAEFYKNGIFYKIISIFAVANKTNSLINT